jgi:hypothetical protein
VSFTARKTKGDRPRQELRAEKLLGVQQQKCLDQLKVNIQEVLEHKVGRARSFELKLKSILRQAREL